MFFTPHSVQVCFTLQPATHRRCESIHVVQLSVPHLELASNWIGLCSVLRPLQHSIGYMGDGYYGSKDPTNSIKVLKEATKENKKKHKEHNTHRNTK